MGGAPRIPFSTPTIGDEEIAEVVDTLRSGWLTTGRKVARFEEDFAAYVGSPHAVAVNSCTAGLHLALEAVGIQTGDEVIVPTLTFSSTAAVVAHCGARPVLADCVEETLNVDVDAVEAVIGPRTRAIVPMHMGGLPCDMDPILDLARRHGLAVIEDAAHALPATYKSRRVGSIGDITVFSFYATKTITTGEGGMVVTARDDYARRVRQMSLHGLSHDAWRRYADRGKWFYSVEDLGYKYNLTDIAASLGIHQLKKCDAFWTRRSAIAARYSRALSGLRYCQVPSEGSPGSHAWHLYVLQLNLDTLRGGRDEVLRRLAEAGIGTSVHFIPLHLQPAYQRRYGYRQGDLPRAERSFARILSLPIYPGMTDECVDRVIEAVWSSVRALSR